MSREEKEKKGKRKNTNASTNNTQQNNSSMVKNSLMSNSLLANKENSYSKANKQTKKPQRKEDYSPPVQDQQRDRQRSGNSNTKGRVQRSGDKTKKQKLFPSAIAST